MGEFCKTEVDGRILVVTIDRPERMNALHPPGNHEMAKVFDDFAADPDLWVAIVTGAGERAFCAGNDLRFQAEHGRQPQPDSHFGGLTARFDLTKPVIAAVNGVAMGGGFEIALACDIVVAAENAVFALPEPRVGLVALAGGVHRLTRSIPYHKAMGMILTGRRVSAQEGSELGFVTEVVPQGQALAAAKRWAAQILECSPVSIRTSKDVIARGANFAALAEAYRHPYESVDVLRSSQDTIEGPKAFAEKRKPNWTGR